MSSNKQHVDNSNTAVARTHTEAWASFRRPFAAGDRLSRDD
jgi:hypothetical protein